MTRRRRGVAGVALAGGSSRRLGHDKRDVVLPALAHLPESHGLTLFEWTVRRLASVCADVLIADRGRASRSTTTGARSVLDGQGRGPLAGILGAASACPEHSLLVLACDLPLVPVALLEILSETLAGGRYDWVVPRGPHGLEPTCAGYGPAALERLRDLAVLGVFALHRLEQAAGNLRLLVLEGPALGRFGEPARLFLNLNTEADLRTLAELGEESCQA